MILAPGGGRLRTQGEAALEDPLAMLGLQAGDAKIIRNAGARVTDDGKSSA